MRCPKCQAPTTVADSRQLDGTTKRRRVCGKCRNRFSTVEILEPVKAKAVNDKAQSLRAEMANLVTILRDMDKMLREIEVNGA